jgi:hypothetical protein
VLARLRTLLRNRIHAVLADHGHDRPAGCWTGRLSSLAIIGRHLPASSSFVLARALTGATDAGAAA